MDKITLTKKQLQATFAEWDRRYRANPEKFMNEAKRLLTKTPKDYGQACAPYFLKVLRNIRKNS